MGTAAREEKELRTRQNPEASRPEGKGREQEGAKGLQKPSSTQRSTVSTLLQTEGAALHAALLMLSWVSRAAHGAEPTKAHQSHGTADSSVPKGSQEAG